MTEITGEELLRSIQSGFDSAFRACDSILMAKDTPNGPGLLSANFVCEVGHAIHRRLLQASPALNLRVIKVNESVEKESGEWLVDACITEDHSDANGVPFIDRIVFAMESESSTRQRAFNVDFAKLVPLHAQYKLHLNGLSQRTPNGMRTYIESRCALSEAALRRIRPPGEFYLGFWPSPEKPKTSSYSVDSMWKGLQCGKWSHLREIRLFHFDKSAEELIEVPPAA